MIYSEHQNGRSVAVSLLELRASQIVQINFSFEVVVQIKKFVWLNADKIIWVPQLDHTLSNGLKLQSTLITLLKAHRVPDQILGYCISFKILNPERRISVDQVPAGAVQHAITAA